MSGNVRRGSMFALFLLDTRALRYEFKPNRVIYSLTAVDMIIGYTILSAKTSEVEERRTLTKAGAEGMKCDRELYTAESARRHHVPRGIKTSLH